MHQLIQYVYDYREDGFMVSLQLLKLDYLAFYVDDDLEPDHARRADKILLQIRSLVADLQKADQEQADREQAR